LTKQKVRPLVDSVNFLGDEQGIGNKGGHIEKGLETKSVGVRARKNFKPLVPLTGAGKKTTKEHLFLKKKKTMGACPLESVVLVFGRCLVDPRTNVESDVIHGVRWLQKKRGKGGNTHVLLGKELCTRGSHKKESQRRNTFHPS